jgi:hypothetical protein
MTVSFIATSSNANHLHGICAYMHATVNRECDYSFTCNIGCGKEVMTSVNSPASFNVMTFVKLICGFRIGALNSR